MSDSSGQEGDVITSAVTFSENKLREQNKIPFALHRVLKVLAVFQEGEKKQRKQIRKVLKDKKLAEETRHAAKEEEERRKRIKERQKLVTEPFTRNDPHVAFCACASKMCDVWSEFRSSGCVSHQHVQNFQYNAVTEIDEETKETITTKCVLETTDDDKKEALIEVNSGLVKKLKPHQVEGTCWLGHFGELQWLKNALCIGLLCRNSVSVHSGASFCGSRQISPSYNVPCSREVHVGHVLRVPVSDEGRPWRRLHFGALHGARQNPVGKKQSVEQGERK